MSKRDDFDQDTVNALAKRAAFICTNPKCKALTIAPSSEDENKFVYIGKAAHITAAADGGPRYSSNLTPEERKSINNGIFLCSSCADMIDKNNGIDFSIELLKQWKNDHEVWVRKNLNKSVKEDTLIKQSFIVTSHDQRGGITAGIVNINSQPRKLNPEIRVQLKQFFPDKAKGVTIRCVLGDSESLNFANEIKEYLIGEGYKINGMFAQFFNPPVFGQTVDRNTLTITVGAKE